jgi:hypothetical protein
MTLMLTFTRFELDRNMGIGRATNTSRALEEAE